MALGPLVETSSKVTRESLMRNLPLVARFVHDGCDQGVVHGQRLEVGLKGVMASSPTRCGKYLGNSHGITNHIQAHFKFLRDFKREEEKALKDEFAIRSYPKTAAVRKLMSPMDVMLVKTTLNKINLPDDTDRDDDKAPAALQAIEDAPIEEFPRIIDSAVEVLPMNFYPLDLFSAKEFRRERQHQACGLT